MEAKTIGKCFHNHFSPGWYDFAPHLIRCGVIALLLVEK
jgi:hypothetical protein